MDSFLSILFCGHGGLNLLMFSSQAKDTQRNEPITIQNSEKTNIHI